MSNKLRRRPQAFQADSGAEYTMTHTQNIPRSGLFFHISTQHLPNLKQMVIQIMNQDDDMYVVRLYITLPVVLEKCCDGIYIHAEQAANSRKLCMNCGLGTEPSMERTRMLGTRALCGKGEETDATPQSQRSHSIMSFKVTS